MTNTLAIPVTVGVDETTVSVDVTADSLSAGNMVPYSTASGSAVLQNAGRLNQAAVQYRIDNGPWITVDINQTSNLNIDFSMQTLRIRRALHTIPSVPITLVVRGLPGNTLYAGEDRDPITGISGGDGGGSSGGSPGSGIGLGDVPFFVGPSAPSVHPTRYAWFQTGMGISGNDMTLWVEDGQ